MCPAAGRGVISVREPPFADAGFRVLDAEEPEGANVLALGETVLVSAAAPGTARRLVREGVAVQVVDVSELHAGDGALTCLSLRLPSKVSSAHAKADDMYRDVLVRQFGSQAARQPPAGFLAIGNQHNLATAVLLKNICRPHHGLGQCIRHKTQQQGIE